MNELVAVIIPTFGQFDYVRLCLQSLVRLTSDYRCIVIDDGSPDWDAARLEEFRRIVPAECFHFERFETNRGLTAAWNRGLELARQFGNSYAALVNSDTLFTPGWLPRTLAALRQVDLVGPMSNAPGEHAHQQIQRVWKKYRLDDSPEYLAEVSWRLRKKYGYRTWPGRVNGFWMAAKSETWWANAFDAAHVFDPAKRLTGNETEFQKRFRGKTGVARDVFIFHYRSVSRGLENVEPIYNIGAFRPPADVPPVGRVTPCAPSAGAALRAPAKPRARLLHVGLVCNEFPPASHGGTGSSYRDLAQGLAAAGHRVTVVGVYRPAVLRDLPPDQAAPDLRVARLRHWPAWFGFRFQMLADRWRLKRWLERAHRRAPFDVIECSDYGGWLSAGGPRDAATIVRIRGSNIFFDHELNRLDGGLLESDLERRCLMRATALGAVSQYAARRMLDLCGQPSRPVTVIYNAVDMDVFSPAPGVAVEPGLIVFINTVGPRKGIGQLVEAMNHVCAAHPAARLVAIGRETRKGTDGNSYAAELLDRVRPEFRNRLTFTGRLSRDGGVLDYLRKAGVCCYPSHMETFGIAPVEAMSVGRPTIYSRTGPGPEIIEDGVSGLLCDPRDPRDIADKILAVLNNPALAAALGQNARRRVQERFNQKDWIRRNLEFFESCLP